MTDIVERLRGIYRVPITDGLGKVDGNLEPDNENEFVRKFPSPPIQLEAADEIERLQRERDHFYTQFQIAWAALTPVSENEKRGMERVLAILRSKQSTAVDEGNWFGPTWSARNKAFKECAEMLRLALEAEAPPETREVGI